MLFWIIVGLIAAAIIYIVWREMGDSYGSPVALGALTAIFGLMLGAAAWFGVALITKAPLGEVKVGEQTLELRALGNNSAIEGRSYFLGGGYVKDKRVLNYITSDSGAIKVQQSDAKDSVIYEGAEKATVKITHIDYVNGWLLPWPIGDKYEYEFHIPHDSVVESYTLDNK